jgi:acetyl-CoA/propionyl-CoA carboxylase biotin carboxyl carrier protein
MGMRYDVALEDRTVHLEVEAASGGWRVRTWDDGKAGDWRAVDGRWVRDGELLLVHEGRQRAVGTHVDGDQVHLQADGHGLTAEVVDPMKVRADLAGGTAEGQVKTPMPGVVVRVPATVGQTVAAGDVLVVVEAMKMENEFKSPVAGTVASIPVAVGDTLESNAVLAVVDPAS